MFPFPYYAMDLRTATYKHRAAKTLSRLTGRPARPDARLMDLIEETLTYNLFSGEKMKTKKEDRLLSDLLSDLVLLSRYYPVRATEYQEAGRHSAAWMLAASGNADRHAAGGDMPRTARVSEGRKRLV